MLLSMHKKIPYDYVSQFQDCSLQVLPAGNRKTGLIEKKSAGMIKEWKAYSFELDYMRGIFKCKKSGPFGRNSHIQLKDITEVKQTSSTNAGRYHFEVHFKGRNSPWELCVYSRAERQEWIDVLNEHSKNEVDDTYSAIDEYEFIDMAYPPNARPKRAALVQERNAPAPIQEGEVYEMMFRAFKDKLDDVLGERENPPGPSSLVSTAPPSQTTQTHPRRARSPLPPPPCPPLPPPPVETQAPPDPPEQRETYQHFLPLLRLPPLELPPRLPISPPAMLLSPKPTHKTSQPEVDEEDIYDDLTFQETDIPHQPSKPLLLRKTQQAVSPSNPPSKPSPVVLSNDTAGRDLELLEKKALSIPLSALSEMKKIGEGQFGEVYRAEMGSTTVAVKIVKQYTSRSAMDQFEREMSTMSQVSHTNIVTLFGIIREGPFSPALVMEFLPFGNLKMFLKREKQTQDFLIKCMIDVAMGMHYLGEKGLIHRDLAARNVLVDKEKRCKVADFGLLREVPKEEECVYVAKGDGNSPLRWMAPESITDNIFSPASDVWSYGILQWEMFHPNKNPYPDMTTMQMITKVTTGYRLAIPDGCPSLVESIMRACWHHNPKDRPTFLRISNLLIRRDRLPI